MREPSRLHRPPFSTKPLRFALVLCALLVLPALSHGQTRAAPPTCEQLIADASRRHGLDYFVFRALVYQESGCKPSVVSPKGAKGLTQLMPATAARFGVKNPFDPAENIEGGAKYMRWLLGFFGGDYALALAGYNAGEGAVMKYGRRIPPYKETQAYVANILRSSQSSRRAPQYLQLTALNIPPAAPSRAALPAPPTAEAQEKPKVPTASRYFWQ